jgi:hypothetical protein
VSKEISLIDHFIARPNVSAVSNQLGKDILGLARKAAKFDLAETAVEIAACMVRDDPVRLLQCKPFAPFPVTWIEWDHTRYLTTIGAKSTMPNNVERDHALLYDADSIYMISRNRDEANSPFVWPICFHLNTPTRNATRATEVQFWGSSYWRIADLPSDVPVKLSDLHSMQHIGKVRRSEIDAVSLRETVGDLRNILAILHTVTRKGAVVNGNTGGIIGSVLRGSKRVVCHAKATITVDLDLERPVEYATSEPARITHDVKQRRGGFVENYIARESEAQGCDHDWRLVTSFGHVGKPNERYICNACGGKKWRRKAFQRDPEVRPYLVEASRAIG